MDVGVADADCMHLHEHLIGSGLRLWNFFDLPRTAHSGNDGSLHITSSYRDSMRAPLDRCMILHARFANHTPMLRFTVIWRMVGTLGLHSSPHWGNSPERTPPRRVFCAD